MGPYLERWNKEIVIFVRKEFVLLNKFIFLKSSTKFKVVENFILRFE